jgi:hypothetical protein
MFAFLGQAIESGGDRIQHPRTEWCLTPSAADLRDAEISPRNWQIASRWPGAYVSEE